MNLTKADLEKLVDELTAKTAALEAEAAAREVGDIGNSDAITAKDKEIAEAKGLAASLQEDNQKLRDELDTLNAEREETKKVILDGADSNADETARADKAEIALAEQRSELDALRKDNGKLREKLERALRGGSTLHGHIDDLKAPY